MAENGQIRIALAGNLTVVKLQCLTISQGEATRWYYAGVTVEKKGRPYEF